MKATSEMIAVMQHFEKGGAIERWVLSSGKWDTWSTPAWDWLNSDYRIAPEKPKLVLRPWRTEEVPMPMIIRPYNDIYRRYSVVMEKEGIVVVTSEHSLFGLSTLVLSTDYEHSVDGCKTWWPCGVVEEVK